MKSIGFDKVYHLKGGILKYLESTPENDSYGRRMFCLRQPCVC